MASIDNIQLHNSEIPKSLLCPVCLECFSSASDQRAVSLVVSDPEMRIGNLCGHTFCLFDAVELLHSGPKCPLCRATFIGFVPNPLITEIADECLSRIQREENDVTRVDFPGKGGVFDRCAREWDDLSGGQRCLNLISKTEDSVFTEFTIFGQKVGGIWIGVKVRNESEMPSVIEYFRRCGLKYRAHSWNKHLTSIRVDSKQKTLMLRIFKLHNEIPEPYLSLAERLVKLERWK